MSSCEECGAWIPGNLAVCRNCGWRIPTKEQLIKSDSERSHEALTTDESPVKNGQSPRSGLAIAFWLYWVVGSIAFGQTYRFFEKPEELRALVLLNLLYSSWAAFMVWAAAGRSEKGIGILAKIFISIAWILGVTIGISALVVLNRY